MDTVRTALPLAFAWLALGAAAGEPPPREPALRWQDAKLLAEAFDRIQADYVDEVASRRLAIEALRGMLAGLDPHSAYLTPEEYAALGEYTDRAPAEAAPPTPAPDAPAPAASRGTARPPPPVPAGAVAFQSASVIGSLPRPGLAHLRIGQFNVGTADEVTRALARLREPAPLAGLVLDLRGNAGGVFGAGAEVADLFVAAGVLLRAEGRAADASFTREATPGDLLEGAPLIVVVDGATASAAEIVAGALQDRGRALVLGERTYGKGSVQSVIPLRSGGAIKFTTARYRLPSGRAIDGQGIEPDLPLAALARGAADPALDLALERALDAVAAAARTPQEVP
jgi:carboxyl-terminal processing protease